MLVNILLFLFSNVMVICSIMVIFVQNMIYSVLFLVLSFVSAASILFLIGCSYFGLIFLLIYVGAISVFFLFVVMMLDVKTLAATRDNFDFMPLGFMIGLIFYFSVIDVLHGQFYVKYYFTEIYVNWYTLLDNLPTVKTLGQVLYTYYVFQFLLGGIILTLGVIGCVLLLAYSPNLPSSYSVSKQLSRNQQNALYYM